MEKIIKQQVRTHVERVNRLIEKLPEDSTDVARITTDYASCYGGWAFYYYDKSNRLRSTGLNTRLSTQEAYNFLMGIEFSLYELLKLRR